ncbi:MAG: sulfotransferase [Flavobacteriaceae bacterium]|nr:sulfotransferase [Flavobacteriaceae bacterium]
MMQETKTNLFVVGAMKAGTTSFIDLLSQHSEIYSPPVKEPHYFVNKLPLSLYEPGRFFSLDAYLETEFPKPLHITKLETASQYEKIYSQCRDELYRLDASTAYLHAEEAAALIHEYNPNAKIIILLRDPLKRAFSHFKMDIGKGRVKVSFEELIKNEIEQYKNGQLPWYSYLGMSFYMNPINRYKKLFSDVQVVQFHNLIGNQDRTLSEIAGFLSINDFTNVTVEHKNIARKPLFPKLFFLLKRLGVKDYFSKLFSSTFKQWLAKKTSSNSNFEMELSDDTRRALEQIFNKESQI